MREIIWQTLAALAAVHAGDVAHRDVKPENLLLSWDAAGPLDAGAFSGNHWPIMDMHIRRACTRCCRLLLSSLCRH